MMLTVQKVLESELPLNMISKEVKEMETEKKTPNQKLDVTIDISFRFTNEGIVIDGSKIKSGNVEISNLIKAIDNAQQENKPLLNI